MSFSLFLVYLAQNSDKNDFILSNIKNTQYLEENYLTFSKNDKNEEKKRSVSIYFLIL